MKPSALIVANQLVERCGRVRRMAEWLKKDFSVSLIGTGRFSDADINYFEIARLELNKTGKLISLVSPSAACTRFSYFGKEYERLKKFLRSEPWELIVCQDLGMLPIVFSHCKMAKIVFDAREYYPKHFSDRFLWQLLNGRINYNICSRYMPAVDFSITVSDGLKSEYQKNLGISAYVIESFPDHHSLAPTSVDPNKIRIIHHGSCNRNRRLELMMQTVDILGDRFELDLMLVNTDSKNLEFLQAEADRRSNVRILPPVAFDELIPFCNQYDIGMFIAPPVNPNLKNVLPNKFFEFIQSRLMIAIGPSPDMAKWVKTYGLGKIADEFTPQAMANALAEISGDEVMCYKNNAHAAASKLNSEAKGRDFLNLLKMHGTIDCESSGQKYET